MNAPDDDDTQTRIESMPHPNMNRKQATNVPLLPRAAFKIIRASSNNGQPSTRAFFKD